jgi:hypothetical protein
MTLSRSSFRELSASVFPFKNLNGRRLIFTWRTP